MLPVQAQFSTVSQITAKDFNGDGQLDLLLLGNRSDNRLKIGSIDANYGCLLAGDGKGGFRYVPQTASGLCIMGDVKSVTDMIIDGKNTILIGVCNDALQAYQVSK